MLLVLVNLALMAGLIYGIISQIAIPLAKGNKLFPFFRKSEPVKQSELKKEVATTKETVADLKEATVDLTELQALKKEKAKLESQIDKLNK
jgi:hypothetical protein